MIFITNDNRLSNITIIIYHTYTAIIIKQFKKNVEIIMVADLE